MDKKVVISSEFKDAVFLKYKANRRISIRDEITDVKDPVFNILNMIINVNALPENTKVYCDRDIDQFMIPVEFKDLVLPNSVRYDVGNRSSKDLLVRTKGTGVADYNEYLNSIARIRALYRKSSDEDLVPLSDLRKDVSFEDVRSRAAFKGKEEYIVHYEGVPFVPILLSKGKEFFEDHYYNVAIDEPLQEFINTLHN